MNKIKKVGWGFEICNMHCRHCYNSSTERGCKYTFEQLKEIADKICPQIEDINFGTGEFICNPNALDLARYIKDTYPHVKMAVTSNGSTIVQMEPEEVKRLFSDIDISLDYPDEKKHCDFRRHEKSWEWAIGALRVLDELQMPHSIVTCITSETKNEDLEGLLGIARQYRANLRFNWFRKVGRGNEDLRITARRAWEIIEFLSDKVVFECIDPIFAGVLGVEAIPCPAGRISCRIHASMDISCYPFLKGAEWSGGNILDKGIDLDAIYTSAIFQKLRARKVAACQDCEFEKTCKGGCITRAVLHNGSMSEVDDYCPVAASLDINRLKRIKIRLQPTSELVHNGYLCTTICRPIV
ncbi:MAG: radical SAM protein [Candidatus Pacebacteria bacterium]|nr:radical SAM protein [Candidatus Paceibacterota bacterium]